MNRLRLSLTGFFGPNEHYLVAEQPVSYTHLTLPTKA